MNSFLETILIILLVYYALKIILKFSKPYLMRYVAKKANERFGQAFGNTPFNAPNQNQDEGDVTIDSSKANTKTSKNSVGEYVDFEEID
jgi:ABC-type bacteriocin/lantibiotic exporter with double-glycine peptidase domain